MNQSIKCFGSIQKGAKDATAIIDVIIYGLFQAVQGIHRRTAFLKTKLVLRRREKVHEHGLEHVLIQFRGNGGYGYRRDHFVDLLGSE